MSNTDARRERAELAAAGLRRDALEQCDNNTTDAMTALVIAILAIAREEPAHYQQRAAALRTVVELETARSKTQHV